MQDSNILKQFLHFCRATFREKILIYSTLFLTKFLKKISLYFKCTPLTLILISFFNNACNIKPIYILFINCLIPAQKGHMKIY